MRVLRYAGFCLVGAGCAHVEVGQAPPGVPAETAEPEVRVAIGTDGDTLRIGGGGGLLVADDAGRPLLELPPGTPALAARRSGGIVLLLGGVSAGPAPRLELASRDPDGTVRVAGRDYRGRVALSAEGMSLVAVNRLGIEAYVAGVVNAEMGRRAPGEEAALEAQAIVSRTYALVALGRRRNLPWDLLATLADQAYLGIERETPAGLAAVAATRGTILTYQGAPIEAFFHSTCGDYTAAGDEVFVNGALPYLRSLRDAGPDGRSWCAASPRYRWREEWTAERLRATLRQTLPALGVAPDRIGEVLDLHITGRTPSARVSGLRIHLPGAVVPVSGSPAVREVLRPEPGQLLRSAAFDLAVTSAGGRVARVVLDGRGAGHGVGMCQWGAVGRARAGQSAARMLEAYFPGTRLERRW